MYKLIGIIKIVLVVCGVLLVLGAMGNGDYYGYLTASDYVHIAVGFALVGAVTAGQIAAEREQ